MTDGWALRGRAQVQEVWLGVGKGHAVVVSAVIDGSPAEKALRVHDILVQIDRVIVESFPLEGVKEVLRELGTSAEVKVYRRRDPLAYLRKDNPTVEPLTRAKHLSIQKKQLTGGAKVSRRATATVWGKPGTKRHNPRAISSIWDGAYNDGHGMTPQRQEKELKRMLRDAHRNGERLDVVVTRHAVIDPSAGRRPQSTTA